MTTSFRDNFISCRHREHARKYYNRDYLNLRKNIDCRDVALMTTSSHVDIRYGRALDPIKCSPARYQPRFH